MGNYCWQVSRSIQKSAITKFVLFMTFTILYCYFSYKTLPSRGVTRPTTGKKSNATWHIIKLANDPLVDLYDIEEDMAERRETVVRTCQENPEAILKPNAWEFVIDAHHSLVWCNVFKAASSAWIHNFNLLGGYDESYLVHAKHNPISLLRTQFPRPTLSQLKVALQSSLSFLITRDPLERLLSAYRNKIETLHGKYYSKMAKSIVSKYRRNAKNVANVKPNFKEFVQYVINSTPNEHWAPIYKFCTPCTVNFTVIAKLETLPRDQEYIIRKSGIDDILTAQIIQQQNRVGALRRTRNLLRRYYSQLDITLLRKLLDIYRIDYEMFGYNATKYFNYLKTG